MNEAKSTITGTVIGLTMLGFLAGASCMIHTTAYASTLPFHKAPHVTQQVMPYHHNAHQKAVRKAVPYHMTKAPSHSALPFETNGETSQNLPYSIMRVFKYM